MLGLSVDTGERVEPRGGSERTSKKSSSLGARSAGASRREEEAGPPMSPVMRALMGPNSPFRMYPPANSKGRNVGRSRSGANLLAGGRGKSGAGSNAENDLLVLSGSDAEDGAPLRRPRGEQSTGLCGSVSGQLASEGAGVFSPGSITPSGPGSLTPNGPGSLSGRSTPNGAGSPGHAGFRVGPKGRKGRNSPVLVKGLGSPQKSESPLEGGRSEEGGEAALKSKSPQRRGLAARKPPPHQRTASGSGGSLSPASSSPGSPARGSSGREGSAKGIPKSHSDKAGKASSSHGPSRLGKASSAEAPPCDDAPQVSPSWAKGENLAAPGKEAAAARSRSSRSPRDKHHSGPMARSAPLSQHPGSFSGPQGGSLRLSKEPGTETPGGFRGDAIGRSSNSRRGELNLEPRGLSLNTSIVRRAGSRDSLASDTDEDEGSSRRVGRERGARRSRRGMGHSAYAGDSSDGETAAPAKTPRGDYRKAFERVLSFNGPLAVLQWAMGRGAPGVAPAAEERGPGLRRTKSLLVRGSLSDTEGSGSEARHMGRRRGKGRGTSASSRGGSRTDTEDSDGEKAPRRRGRAGGRHAPGLPRPRYGRSVGSILEIHGEGEMEEERRHPEAPSSSNAVVGSVKEASRDAAQGTVAAPGRATLVPSSLSLKSDSQSPSSPPSCDGFNASGSLRNSSHLMLPEQCGLVSPATSYALEAELRQKEQELSVYRQMYEQAESSARMLESRMRTEAEANAALLEKMRAEKAVLEALVSAKKAEEERKKEEEKKREEDREEKEREEKERSREAARSKAAEGGTQESKHEEEREGEGVEQPQEEGAGAEEDEVSAVEDAVRVQYEAPAAVVVERREGIQSSNTQAPVADAAVTLNLEEGKGEGVASTAVRSIAEGEGDPVPDVLVFVEEVAAEASTGPPVAQVQEGIPAVELLASGQGCPKEGPPTGVLVVQRQEGVSFGGMLEPAEWQEGAGPDEDAGPEGDAGPDEGEVKRKGRELLESEVAGCRAPEPAAGAQHVGDADACDDADAGAGLGASIDVAGAQVPELHKIVDAGVVEAVPRAEGTDEAVALRGGAEDGQEAGLKGEQGSDIAAPTLESTEEGFDAAETSVLPGTKEGARGLVSLWESRSFRNRPSLALLRATEAVPEDDGEREEVGEVCEEEALEKEREKMSRKVEGLIEEREKMQRELAEAEVSELCRMEREIQRLRDVQEELRGLIEAEGRPVTGAPAVGSQVKVGEDSDGTPEEAEEAKPEARLLSHTLRPKQLNRAAVLKKEVPGRREDSSETETGSKSASEKEAEDEESMAAKEEAKRMAEEEEAQRKAEEAKVAALKAQVEKMRAGTLALKKKFEGLKMSMAAQAEQLKQAKVDLEDEVTVALVEKDEAAELLERAKTTEAEDAKLALAADAEVEEVRKAVAALRREVEEHRAEISFLQYEKTLLEQDDMIEFAVRQMCAGPDAPGAQALNQYTLGLCVAPEAHQVPVVESIEAID